MRWVDVIDVVIGLLLFGGALYVLAHVSAAMTAGVWP